MNEGREMEENGSGSAGECLGRSSSAKRQKTPTANSKESLEASAAPKQALMRDSEALLTVLG